jgi:hypothetical protein
MATEQKVEQFALQALNIAASVAAAVGGIALPGFLAGIPILTKIIDEAKVIAAGASAAGKAIPYAVAVEQALVNLGLKSMDANDMATIRHDLEHP